MAAFAKAVEQTKEPQSLGDPIGEKPYVEVVLKPLSNHVFLNATGYLGFISKVATVAQLHSHLCLHVGADVAETLTGLMYEGNEIDACRTLHDSGVTLPGPSACRAGRKLELFFDLRQDILAAKRKMDEDAKKGLSEDEQRRRFHAEEEGQEEKRRQEACSLFKWVEKHIGMPRALSEARRAADPETKEPRHYLEQCSEEQCRAIEQLMRQTGGQDVCVKAAFWNDNAELREHYERSKARMQSGSNRISKWPTATSQVVHGQERAKFTAMIGEYDVGVNECPLWHGTPSPEGAAGICSSGFDINFVGTTTDSGWYGHGFYFSDQSFVSLGYSRGHHVSSQFPRCQIMLLSRVVVGNIRNQTRIPDNDEDTRMRVTAECLGPGGVFGPASPFHTLLGQGNEYICMSSHQVYPEFVVICESSRCRMAAVEKAAAEKAAAEKAAPVTTPDPASVAAPASKAPAPAKPNHCLAGCFGWMN